MAYELQWTYNEEHARQRVLKCEKGQAMDTYPPELRRSICRSMVKEFKMKQRSVVPIMMLQANTSLSNGKLADEWHEQEITAGDRLEAWGDLTGLPLDPKGVLKARRKELTYIEQEKVWDIASRESKLERTDGK